MKGINLSKYGEVSISNDLILDGKLPLLRTNLKTVPLHYGNISLYIDNLPAFTKRDIIRIPHGYPTAPSHLFFWSYPAGTVQYGVGYFEKTYPGAVFSINSKSDNVNYILEADNSAKDSTTSGLFLQLRYYIFVNQFTDT